MSLEAENFYRALKHICNVLSGIVSSGVMGEGIISAWELSNALVPYAIRHTSSARLQ